MGCTCFLPSNIFYSLSYHQIYLYPSTCQSDIYEFLFFMGFFFFFYFFFFKTHIHRLGQRVIKIMAHKHVHLLLVPNQDHTMVKLLVHPVQHQKSNHVLLTAKERMVHGVIVQVPMVAIIHPFLGKCEIDIKN